MSLDETFQARLALVDYAKSKITDHIGYVISILVIFFALYNMPQTISPIVTILLTIRDYVMIILIGPFLYMLGRILYWSSYLDAVFLVKVAQSSTFNPEAYFHFDETVIKSDFIHNTIWGLNRNAGLAAIQRKGYFGKVGKHFKHSEYLLRMTGLSILAAVLYGLILWALCMSILPQAIILIVILVVGYLS